MMAITALLTLENQTFLAQFSDGRALRESDLDMLADKLVEMGLTADDVQTLDWREGDSSLMRGQIIAIKARMRERRNIA